MNRFSAMKMSEILIAIPSYDRPEVLGAVLKRLPSEIPRIVVEADASSEEILKKYREVLSSSLARIVAELHVGHRGSAKARNALLELAARNIDGVKYVLLLDDDYLIPPKEVLQRMTDDLEMLEDVGVLGGRVMNLQKRIIDPDFSLNLPTRVVDSLMKLTGFIFSCSTFKVNFTEVTTPFMLIRSSLLGRLSYDENYQGTGYREETDLQIAIKRLGLRIFSDDRAYVYHLSAEKGGVRDQRSECSRMYWKARNHTYFILKWHRRELIKRTWYTAMGAILLIIYKPLCLGRILLGLQHGYQVWSVCCPASRNSAGL
jgi:GT2 family glycosyltransferase